MCLTTVKERYFFPRNKTESKIGYKWFDSNYRLYKLGYNKELRLANHIIGDVNRYELNKWYTSTKWSTLEGFYFTGFHILEDIESAYSFQYDMNKDSFSSYYSVNSQSDSNLKLAKVEYRNIVARGYQMGNVVVAQKMKIVELL